MIFGVFRCVQGRQSLARYLQSVNSEYFSADIHPACSVGRSLFLASGTCVVIGETARLGDDVLVMQGVTLGGNGKEKGDRHPKIGTFCPPGGASYLTRMTAMVMADLYARRALSCPRLSVT
jgi:serine acetyltransferase